MAVSRVLGVQGGAPSSLDEIWPKLVESIEESERPFAQMLCYGMLRWWSNLHHRVSANLKKPVKQKDKILEVLMVLGAFQLISLRTPKHAAVFTSVEIAKRVKGHWAGSLVNGVLRSIERSLNPERSACLSVSYDGVGLAVKFAHPEWMVEKIQQEWPEHFLQILEAAQSPGPLCIRVNESRMARDDYMAKHRDDLLIKSAPHAASGIYVESLDGPVTSLPGFDEGLVSVQDEGAQLAIQALASVPAAGVMAGRVLDACAAPGGKALHWLEKRALYQQKNDHQPENNQSPGAMVVLDKSKARMEKVDENLARMSAHQVISGQVQTLVADVNNTSEWWNGQVFDAILLDVPCSGSGVMRRHPDIKWLRKVSDIAQFAAQQSRLLDAAWGVLGSGGFLLYCTCSLFHGENEAVIGKFLSRVEAASVMPLTLPGTVALTHGVQRLPEQNGPDGFYYCLLQKLNDS